MEQARGACTIDIKGRYSSKEGYAECLVGFQKYFLFRAAPKEPNYQSNILYFNGKIFDSNEAVKNELIQFFASKNQTFYESGIMKLTER